MFKKPIMYVRDFVIYPGSDDISLVIGREDSMRAIDCALNDYKGDLCVVTQKRGEQEEPLDHDIFAVGTLCQIKKCLNFNDGTRKILLEAKKPFSVQNIIYEDDIRFVQGECYEVEDSQDEIDLQMSKHFKELLLAYHSKYQNREGQEQLEQLLSKSKTMGDWLTTMTNLVAYPYHSVQKKNDLEQMKRDFDYWKSLNDDDFLDMSERLRKRALLLTALPIQDKIKVLENILIEEGSA